MGCLFVNYDTGWCGVGPTSGVAAGGRIPALTGRGYPLRARRPSGSDDLRYFVTITTPAMSVAAFEPWNSQ